jgi:type III pantothenate kinase
MQLLVDTGNSSIKWALRRGAGQPLTGFGAALHGGALPLDLLAVWDELDRIDAVLAADVGPQSVRDAVAQVSRARFGIAPRWLHTRAEACGMRIAYADPAQLGVDRFLALIAAHRRAQAAAQPMSTLIVDAGTAVTFDALLADGRHLGGLILPGIRMQRESLLAGTQIPRHEPTDANLPWAVDTGQAIAAASIQAPAALLERLHHRLAAHAGAAPKLILTGGDAERLAAACDLPAELAPELVPELVLEGLAAFA